MQQTKTAAPVLEHRNGQAREFESFHASILPHVAPVFKYALKETANFALLACAFGAVCALCGLIEGGGLESLRGLAACLLGGWSAMKVREVMNRG